jgi:ferredoxin
MLGPLSRRDRRRRNGSAGGGGLRRRGGCPWLGGALSFWMEEFVKCIKCYGCSNICPMCFCNECSLKCDDLVKRGELPPEIPVFHHTRAMHMVGRCIDCGLCEEACPSTIPLRTLYKKINGILEDFVRLPAPPDWSRPALAVQYPGSCRRKEEIRRDNHGLQDSTDDMYILWLWLQLFSGSPGWRADRHHPLQDQPGQRGQALHQGVECTRVHPQRETAKDKRRCCAKTANSRRSPGTRH